MKNKLIILLGIFIFMIIPYSNVFASSGTATFNVSPSVIWHKYNGSSSDIYTGSSHNLTSANDLILLPYYFSTNNTRVISNENYGLNFLYFSDSNGGFGTCTENCDVTVSFDWAVSYPNWDTTGRHLANSYFQTLVDTDDIDNSINLNMALITTNFDNSNKQVTCSSELTYYSTPGAQGPEYPWYYKFHATCKTSNIQMVNRIQLSVPWWKYNYYTEIGLRIYLSNISYTTGPYTGTQDYNTDSIYQTNYILNNIDSADLDSSDKLPANTSEFSSMQTAQNNLYSKMNNADINNMNIAIDTNSSNWVWGRVTDFLGSHALLMSFLISMLSIGIIKMALNR